MGRLLLSSMGAGIALLIAVQSDHEPTKIAATVACSSFASFTLTSLALQRYKAQKSRTAGVDAYLEMLRQMHQSDQYIEAERPAACRGCSYYHGQYYGGNLLVCALHPQGAESDRCKDWEEENTAQDSTKS
jgi:hypothetical protein